MAGSVLAVGAMLVAASLALGLAATGGAAVTARRAAGAADNAAIAAADTVSGALSGEPCARAAEVARASGARLVSCETQEFDALVTVETAFAGLVARARARAGPMRSGRAARAMRRAAPTRLTVSGVYGVHRRKDPRGHQQEARHR